MVQLFGSDVPWTSVALAAAALLAAAWFGAQLAARLVRNIFLRVAGDDPTAFSAPIVRTPIRIARAVVFLLLLAVLAQPALELAGVDIEGGLHLEGLVAWATTTGVRIGIIILLALGVMRIVASVGALIDQGLGGQQGPEGLERAKRAKTLGGLVRNAVNATVGAVAVLMVLQELGLNIMPILTGAGIIGLAVGFGAQTVVKDVISGFFLILEDQVRVGDVAQIGGTSGLVEAINLRTIVLRDLSGTVHVIPNGSVDRVSNLTKDFSFFVLDMGVAYKEDTDRVVALMREVAEDLQRDAVYGQHILEPLDVLGVDDFGDSAVVVKVRLKTVPRQQWFVGREYRRRLKLVFDAAGVEIPFPHRSLYFGEATKPWLVRQVPPDTGDGGSATPR